MLRRVKQKQAEDGNANQRARDAVGVGIDEFRVAGQLTALPFAREECPVAGKMAALVWTAPHIVCPHGRMPHTKSHLKDAWSAGRFQGQWRQVKTEIRGRNHAWRRISANAGNLTIDIND